MLMLETDVRCELDAALLAGTTAVVRKRRDVFDGLHFEAGGFERGDRAFAATAGALHFDFNFLDAELLGFVGGLLSGHLPGKRRALAAALETSGAGAGPAERITLGVGDGHGRVVERGLDVGDADRNIAAGFLFDFDFSHGKLMRLVWCGSW